MMYAYKTLNDLVSVPFCFCNGWSNVCFLSSYFTFSTDISETACMIYGSECNGSCLSSADFIKQTYGENHNPVQPQMTLRPRLWAAVWASRWRRPLSFHHRDDLVVIEPKRWHTIPTANLVRCRACHFLGSWNINKARCGAFHRPFQSNQAEFCIMLQGPLTPVVSLTPWLFWLVFNRNADDLHFHINEEIGVYAHLKEISVGWKILLSDDLGNARWLILNVHLSLQHSHLKGSIIFVIALSRILRCTPVAMQFSHFLVIWWLIRWRCNCFLWNQNGASFKWNFTPDEKVASLLTQNVLVKSNREASIGAHVLSWK